MQNVQKKVVGRKCGLEEKLYEVELSTGKNLKNAIKTSYTPSYTHYPHFFVGEKGDRAVFERKHLFCEVLIKIKNCRKNLKIKLTETMSKTCEKFGKLLQNG